MMRFLVVTISTMLFAGAAMFAQERGVEFSFMPNVSDTTAGSVLHFELAARNEDGSLVTNWDTKDTGSAVWIEIHNSTANLDTNEGSWNQNKSAYSYAKLYDSRGRELANISPNKFYVPNDLFSGGRLQIAFTHTKAESNVYLKIVPKTIFSEKQTSKMYIFRPGPVDNFFVDVSGQARENQVYLERPFEIVIAARDRFLNIVSGEVPVQYTARFPKEIPAIQMNTLPQYVDGLSAIMVTPSKTRMVIEDTLQRFRVLHAENSDISGSSDEYEILDHPPEAFTLNSPLSGTEIQLGDWKETLRFDWNPAEDPYRDIPVSVFDGRTASDTIRYRLFLADFNNLVTKVSYPSDEGGRATSLNLTHWTLAEAAKVLHGDEATRLNAVWSVTATDGIYTITSTSASAPAEAGHTIQADLLTLDVERISESASTCSLKQNYPNPFNPTTTIEYTVPERTPVRIRVFDVYGALVATLVDAQAEPGSYRVVWNGRTDSGSNAPSGSYILTMTAGNQSQSRVMSLIQ